MAGESPLAALLPLAFGELASGDAAELAALKQEVARTTGFPIHSYKDRVIRRRVAVRLRACHLPDYGAYLRLLQRQPAEYGRLLELLTVQVSKFFRNPDVWDVVRDEVLPELLGSRRRSAPLRICSAGCAAGEEPYSASIVMQEYATVCGAPTAGYVISGVDSSLTALRLAERAEYSAYALADTSPARRDRWFSAGAHFRLHSDARQHVGFARLDLLRDQLPAGQDLVFCRNVLIYLERPQQEQVLRNLHATLAPGGFLVLGKAEVPAGELAGLFTRFAPRQRVFRKR